MTEKKIQNNKVKDKINKEMSEGVKKSLKSAKISYLMNAVESWAKSNLGDVSFIGAFATYSIGKGLTDDRIIAYGPKKVLEIHLEELEKGLKKERDFVNW